MVDLRSYQEKISYGLDVRKRRIYDVCSRAGFAFTSRLGRDKIIKNF